MPYLTDVTQMAIFRREPAAQPTGLTQRSVPTFYPEFYRAALIRAGKPASEMNILALSEFTAANLALNAHLWFQALGDTVSQARFKVRFTAATYPAERLVSMPDDMIDFLWAWSPRVHGGLHQFVGSITDTIARKLKDYGDDLPMNLWNG